MEGRKLLLFVVTCTMVSIATLGAQIEFPSLSPAGTVTQMVGHTMICVKYERPCARDRVIYGELVPWNKVWRTGAGWCTKLFFDKQVIIGGIAVEAGAYSLFTIPGKEEWIVILNTDTTLYGSFDYNSNNDVVRLPVKPLKSERYYEALTINIDVIPNNAKIYISWTDTQIGFDVETSTDAELAKYINDELLSGISKEADDYGMAASYYYYRNMNYKEGLKLADKMLKAGGNAGWASRIKMKIYEKLERYKEALEEVNKAIEITRKAEFNKEENRQREMQEWEIQEKRIRAKM